MPDGKLKDRAVTNVIGVMADSDPKGAAGLISSLPVESQDDAAGSLANRWARNDPTAAATWSTTLPEGEAKTKVIRNVVEVWADRDLNKTAAWLERLRPGDSRDAAIHEFSRQVTNADPASAAAWASTISDPERRDGSLERIYRQWSRKDQQGAIDFIANSPAASPQLKQKLLAPR
jgi:hypothetical protein